MSVRKMTWEQIDFAVHEISRYLHDKAKQGQITCVYGVPRGGLVPAVLFSHKLKIPMILDAKLITATTLVVDDITDTGETMELIKHQGITATIFYSKQSKFKPTFTCFEKTDEWIKFPWEVLS